MGHIPLFSVDQVAEKSEAVTTRSDLRQAQNDADGAFLDRHNV